MQSFSILESISVVDVLFIVALILLVSVSGGILYLTTLEWRDRRRRARDKRL